MKRRSNRGQKTGEMHNRSRERREIKRRAKPEVDAGKERKRERKPEVAGESKWEN